MVKQAVIAFFLAVCALQCTTVYAQLIPVNDLDTARVYTDLKDALEKRNGVLRLDLSRQKLSEFPPEIFEFTNLQELILNKCRISELPDRFDLLPNLQRLQCQHNEIGAIPPTILQLKNLVTLDLADNIIEVIPNEIDGLAQLETLALWDNPITMYPENLTQLTQLKVLDLLNNSMSRETQQRLKEGLPKCKIIMSPPCACMDGGE
jgi:Leucine-rich repeat (LRR) protein